jgi:hypothetical protein
VAFGGESFFHIGNFTDELHWLLLAEVLDAFSDLGDVLGAWLDGAAAIIE